MTRVSEVMEKDAYALVVDDHPLVARGLAAFLQTHCTFSCVQVVVTVSECLQWIAENGCPRLVVIDFWLADGAALSLLSRLAAACKETRLLVVSGDDAAGIQTHVREAGAHGFLRKSEPPEVFAQAVSALMVGELWFPHDDSIVRKQVSRRELPIRASDLGLTERQGEVLAMMLRGLPNKRIALALSVSESTIKEHVSGILARLGITTRVEAIALLDGRRLSP